MKEQNSSPRPETLFSTFAVSLAASALIHMGETPDPTDNQVHVNRLLARQTIDTLEMLAQKTKGNLTDEEKNLMQDLLFDLRMRYAQKK